MRTEYLNVPLSRHRWTHKLVPGPVGATVEIRCKVCGMTEEEANEFDSSPGRVVPNCTDFIVESVLKT